MVSWILTTNFVYPMRLFLSIFAHCELLYTRTQKFVNTVHRVAKNTESPRHSVSGKPVNCSEKERKEKFWLGRVVPTAWRTPKKEMAKYHSAGITIGSKTKPKSSTRPYLLSFPAYKNQ